MAINLWTLGGKLTAYSPLPLGTNNKVTVPLYKDYTITFKAKSTSGTSILRLHSWATVNDIQQDLTLTSTFQSFEFTWRETENGQIVLWDKNSIGDITITDILLVEKGLGALTLNGIDSFGTYKSGFTQGMPLTGKSDFTNKKANSVIESSNTLKAVWSTILEAPSSIWWGESNQSGYDAIKTLDTVVITNSCPQNGKMAEHIFSFDVIRHLTNTYGSAIWQGKTTLADMVVVAENIVKNIIWKWHGFGSSPTGNKATMSAWNGSAWIVPVTHTASSISVLTQQTFNDANSVKLFIGSDGFIHILVNADPSNGTIASVINTDYVELLLEVNQSVILDSKWTLHANARVIDEETLELNATGTYQSSISYVNVLPNTRYTMSVSSITGSGGGINVRHMIGETLTDVYDGTLTPSVLTNSFTTGSGVTKLQIYPSNNATPSGTFTFKRPMLTLGNAPIPYEKKRGERMTLPVTIGKNLLQATEHTINGVETNSARMFDFTSNLVQGGTYYLSGWFSVFADDVSTNDRISLAFYYSDGTNTTINNGIGVQIRDGKERFVSVSGTANPSKILITVRIWLFDYSTTGAKLHRTARNVQLEQGGAVTPFEPYRAQTTSKRKVGVGKKSIITSLKNNTTPSNGTNTSEHTVNDYEVITKPIAGFAGYYTRLENMPSLRGRTFTLSFVVGERTIITGEGQVDMTTRTTGAEYYAGRLLLTNAMIGTRQSITINVPTDAQYVGLNVRSGNTVTTCIHVKDVQLEEGSTVSLVAPPSRRGLVMDGLGNRVQLPTLTMDSIEVDCFIDANQPTGSWKWVVDTRTGLTGGWYYLNNVNSAFSTGTDFTVESGGLVVGQRAKVKLKASAPFTDDVTIFASSGAVEAMKGVLYSVKCYLRGEVVASYDFTNPSALTGNVILPTPKNLLPSFDSDKWNIHANARVVGRDVLELNATGAFQISTCKIPTESGARLLLIHPFNTANAYFNVEFYDVNNASLGFSGNNGLPYFTVTAPANTKSVLLRMTHAINGQFTYTKPQVYLLDGKEATIFGNINPDLRASKRTLFAKR